MHEFIRRIYLMEIAHQCKSALKAFDKLKAPLQTSDKDEVFAAIQAFLTATANISKLLWPSSQADETAERRGAELRKHLAVSDMSPLKDRTLRNHFEHF